jgi:uncharacterized protein YigE (DUF2233 family)
VRLSPLSLLLVLAIGACGRSSESKGVPSDGEGPAEVGGAPSPSGRSGTVGGGVSFFRRERKDGQGRNTVFVVVRLDLPRVKLEARAPPHDRLEQLGKEPALLVAANGGFFEADRSPAGLLVSAGKVLSAFRGKGATGVLTIQNGRAELAPRDGFVKRAGLEFAVQCGPRLVEPGGGMGITSDDGKRAARTAACVRREGRELDLVFAWVRNSDRDGPGLYELATWLREPLLAEDASGCEAALNLDGGPSTGLLLRGFDDEAKKPFGPVPWAIAVLPKEGSSAPVAP